MFCLFLPRLQSGMNLQICFVNDSGSDKDSDADDSKTETSLDTPLSPMVSPVVTSQCAVCAFLAIQLLSCCECGTDFAEVNKRSISWNCMLLRLDND